MADREHKARCGYFSGTKIPPGCRLLADEYERQHPR
jgi:hypothetical protein